MSKIVLLSNINDSQTFPRIFLMEKMSKVKLVSFIIWRVKQMESQGLYNIILYHHLRKATCSACLWQYWTLIFGKTYLCKIPEIYCLEHKRLIIHFYHNKERNIFFKCLYFFSEILTYLMLMFLVYFQPHIEKCTYILSATLTAKESVQPWTFLALSLLFN